MSIVDRPYEESYPPWVMWNVASTATLTSITPTTTVLGVPVAQLDCTGTGFAAGAVIMRDGVPLATTVVTAGTVVRTTAFLPTPVGTFNIRVQNPGQLPTNARTMTVTATLRAGDENASPASPEPAEEVPPSDEPPPPGRRGRRS